MNGTPELLLMALPVRLWLWKVNGKPRSGEINAHQCRIKLRYKNAIKDAAYSMDAAFNDNLFHHLQKGYCKILESLA